MAKKRADELGYRPCVGIMVLNQRNQVWIGRRTGSKTLKDPGQQGLWWQMPQGGIDEGEDPAQAAFRELFEETGIERGSVSIIGETNDWLRYDLPDQLVGKKWGGKYRGQRQKWFAMRFTGLDAEVNINPLPPHEVEFDDWRWADHGEVLDCIVPFKREVYVAVLEEFRGLLKR
ncbi:MAG: RNA pyrophosphohydrolase [Alphaproteobacteria bacterium]|nr:RNA pyrophosphohydrolase [Alphaproteobacteria bacterium]